MFSILARVVAILSMVLGLFQAAMGVAIATGFISPYKEALARYTGADSSGEVINRGLYLIVFAVALGTLAEIGIAVRKASLRD